jgi:hypothetical protein
MLCRRGNLGCRTCSFISSYLDHNPATKVTLPFLWLYPIRSQAQDIQSSIPDQTKVGRGRYGDAGIEERRVLHRVAIEALSPVFKHAIHDWRLAGLVKGNMRPSSFMFEGKLPSFLPAFYSWFGSNQFCCLSRGR